MKRHDDPGFWRDASRALVIYGIPAPLFLLFLFWFRFPSMTTIYVVGIVIGFFRVLSAYDWTLKVLIARMVYLVRGKRLAGRPWWYRRFNEDE